MKPLDYTQFLETLSYGEPDSDWSAGLKAIWFEAAGDWEASHEIAQEMHTQLGSWIHAYLHRKEGDRFNAGYWYRRANRPIPKYSLEDELEVLVNRILQTGD